MVSFGVFVTGMLRSYCTVDDVLRLLAGFDLTRLGDGDAVSERVAGLMGAAKAAVDTAAGRDFGYHPDDEVRVDGGGRSSLVLSSEGISPVQAVSRLAVDGVEVTADEYVSYGVEGTIRLMSEGALGGTFPVGRQNVCVKLDWGYPQPPADITLAQAKLIAAEVLSAATGGSGSVESVRLGDYSVSYDSGGENAGIIGRWLADAARAVSRHRRVRVAAV
jgi:hypothetical protein